MYGMWYWCCFLLLHLLHADVCKQPCIKVILPSVAFAFFRSSQSSQQYGDKRQAESKWVSTSTSLVSALNVIFKTTYRKVSWIMAIDQWGGGWERKERPCWIITHVCTVAPSVGHTATQLWILWRETHVCSQWCESGALFCYISVSETYYYLIHMSIFVNIALPCCLINQQSGYMEDLKCPN